MKSLQPPGPGFVLYGIYHNHPYGGTFHLVWSDHDPTEEEVVATCNIDFEEERGEWITVAEVGEPQTIGSATAPR